MPATAAGTLLRQSRLLFSRRAFTRNASTTSEAASAVSSAATKAKDSVSNVASKASEGLSKVSSSASATISSAGSTASNATSQAQGRIGRMIAGVQSMIPPTLYYGRVGLELGKLVVKGQGMGPPSGQHLQQYYQPIMNGLRNPTNAFAHSHGFFHPVEWLNRIRNMNGKDATYAGIVVAEVIGFFTIGEIIGKMKIVGYRGEVVHAH